MKGADLIKHNARLAKHLADLCDDVPLCPFCGDFPAIWFDDKVIYAKCESIGCGICNVKMVLKTWSERTGGDWRCMKRGCRKRSTCKKEEE